MAAPSLILSREREAGLEPHAVRYIHLDTRRAGLECVLGLGGGKGIASVRAGDALFRDETFGPVIPIIRCMVINCAR